jgi:hypothetical protein
MGPYGSDVEFVTAVFAVAMVVLIVGAVLEFIIQRRDK